MGGKPPTPMDCANMRFRPRIDVKCVQARSPSKSVLHLIDYEVPVPALAQKIKKIDFNIFSPHLGYENYFFKN